MALGTEILFDEYLDGHSLAREIHDAVLSILAASGPVEACDRAG